MRFIDEQYLTCRLKVQCFDHEPALCFHHIHSITFNHIHVHVVVELKMFQRCVPEAMLSIHVMCNNTRSDVWPCSIKHSRTYQ